jgi:hypothetical protein
VDLKNRDGVIQIASGLVRWVGGEREIQESQKKQHFCFGFEKRNEIQLLLCADDTDLKNVCLDFHEFDGAESGKISSVDHIHEGIA